MREPLFHEEWRTEKQKIEERLDRWITEFSELLSIAPYGAIEAHDACEELINKRFRRCKGNAA